MKRYRITYSHYRRGEYSMEGTIEELTKAFKYTLETGQSYEHEKGNKKISLNPRGIKSLCTNLYNAKNNAAADGYGGYSFDWIELPKEPKK